MTFVKPKPFREAVEMLGGRSPIGSRMMSSEWQDVPVALRQRAFFSSQVESVRFLQRGRDALGDFLTGAREALPDGQTVLKSGSRAAFVEQMREFALKEGMGPLEGMEGGLRDITSERRLGLIFDVQTRQADDYGYWKQGMDSDVLNEFPAQRFIRVRPVKQERESHTRFEGQVYLKTDPIWAMEINEDFGVPWGPWAWGCGHDVEDVDRDETEQLGLIKPGQEVEPDRKNFNENLRASTVRLDPDLRDKLLEEFGNQIEWDGNAQELRWNPDETARRLKAEAPPERQNPVSDAVNVRMAGHTGEQVRAAFAAIDRVHDGSELPAIDLKNSTRPPLGYFQMQVADDGVSLKADHIGVRNTGPWPALTAVHETGHFLDLESIGAKGVNATIAKDAGMRLVLDAAEKTQAIQALREKLANTSSFALHGEYSYLLKPQEIWARAYAQFVTERSGNATLQRDLNTLMGDSAYKQRQWTAEDFTPLAQAIETLFKNLKQI